MQDFKLRIFDFLKTLSVMVVGLGLLSLVYFFIFPRIILLVPSINRESAKLQEIKIENPDKDNDGLTNVDEINIYGTNPDNRDSNGDGVTDSEEIYKEWKYGIVSNSQKIVSWKSRVNQYEIHSLKDELDLKALAIYNPYGRISPLIMTHITTAFNFRKENKLQESIDELEKILKLDSDSGAAFHHLGLTYYAMGDFNKALDYYRKALQDKDFKSPLLYHDLFVTSQRLGLKDEAITYLKTAINDFPNYLPFYSQAVDYYIESSELETAETFLNQGLKVEPRYSEFFTEMGLIYDKKGDTQKAFEYYKKATIVDLHFALTHMNLSIMYRENFNDPKGALVEALIADEFDPNNSHIKNVLGLAYEANGNADQAIIEYKEGISLDPNFDKLYNNIGIAYGGKGQIDLEEQNYIKAIEINPNYAKAWSNLGTIFLNQGLKQASFMNDDIAKSRSYLEKSVEIDPNYFLSHQALGRVYQRMASEDPKYYPLAELHLKKAIELQYNDPLSHTELGFVYYNQRKNTEAVKEWETAISLGMNNNDVLQILKSIKK